MWADTYLLYQICHSYCVSWACDILKCAGTCRLFEVSYISPQWKSYGRQHLERRLNFLSTVWLLLCFVLLLSKEEIMWVSLISGYPVWVQRLTCFSSDTDILDPSVFPCNNFLPYHYSALGLVLHLHFHDYLIQMNFFLTLLRSIECYTKKIIWDVAGFVHIITANHGLR